MSSLLHTFVMRLHARPGAAIDAIERLEARIQRRLPDDDTAFLLLSNGGEGRLEKGYVSLWSIQEIAELNEEYRIQTYLPEVVAIGTDGGGVCYALDYATSDRPSLITVPLGDLDAHSVTRLGRGFLEGISTLMT